MLELKALEGGMWRQMIFHLFQKFNLINLLDIPFDLILLQLLGY
jgi:hypothetical protein